VNETGLDRGSRKVKTESGRKIASAHKSNMYATLCTLSSPIFLCENSELNVCFCVDVTSAQLSSWLQIWLPGLLV